MEKILSQKLKRQQKYTDDILSGMIDLVRVIDKNNRVVYINKPLKDLVGDIRGQVCYNALGKSCKCERCITETSIKCGMVVQKEEWIKDKRYSVISSPIRDEFGEIYCAVEVFRDVTEKKKMEQTILKQNEKMRNDIDFAMKIQKKMIPENKRISDIIEISSKYIPSELLGGDMFDVLEIDDDNIGVYMADVAGHGVTASILTMFIKQAFKNIKGKEICNNPKEVLNYLSKSFIDLNLDDEYYLTIFYGVYNKKERSFTFSNGGQNCMPIVVKNKEIEQVYLPGLPICSMFEGVNYEVKTITLNKGDRILFYTDGVSEGKNADNVEFESNLYKICKEKSTLNSKELLDDIYDELKAFTKGNITDDVAMLLIETL